MARGREFQPVVNESYWEETRLAFSPQLVTIDGFESEYGKKAWNIPYLILLRGYPYRLMGPGSFWIKKRKEWKC